MLIEPILGYKSSWRILELLFETPRKPVSRKELFEHTDLGNAPLSKGLKRLVGAGLLIKEKKGKKEFYFINFDDPYTRLIWSIWEQERNDTRYLDYYVKVLTSEFLRMILDRCEVDKVILFGSHGKGTASIRSDVDLAVVFRDDLKQELEVTRIAKILEEKSETRIQVHFFTKKSFRNKTKLTDEIKRDGIHLLKG